MGARRRVIWEHGNETELRVSSYSFEPERKVTMGMIDGTGTRCMYCVLEKLGSDRARFTMQVYLEPDERLIADYERNAKATEEAWMQRSLEKLDGLVKERSAHEFDECAPVGFQ